MKRKGGNWIRLKLYRQRRDPRHRLRRPWLWVAIASALVLVIVIDRTGLLLVGNRDDMARYHSTQATVARVVSAHTIDITIPDHVMRRETTRVRLLGVNAPLLAGPNREAERGAEQAFALTTSLVNGETVALELEPERTRDTFGRLLAHVKLPDGQLLNAVLLEAGLAQADERSPHSRLTQYGQAQRIAQQRQRGFWGHDLE